MSSVCKAPTWCDCGDCRFWRKHKYHPRGWLRLKKRYPWEPAIHVRAWRALGRLVREANPIALLMRVEDNGWGYDGYTMTNEVRVARMVLRRLEQVAHVGRALFGQWDSYSGGDYAWWVRGLYRLKATLCIVLGLDARTWKQQCQLVADFIRHTPGRPSSTSVLELMKWAHEQAQRPTEAP